MEQVTRLRQVASLGVLALAISASAGGAPSAQSVVEAAVKQAKVEHKNVLILFGASWCPWCRRFDALLEDPRFKPSFDKSYVIAKITVRERAEKRALENSGWEPILLKLRGAPEKDIPFAAVLDETGQKLAGSYRGNEPKIPGNAGYPHTREEIEGFLAILRKTAPGFTAEDRYALRNLFETQAKASSK